MQRAGAAPLCGEWASHRRGFSCFGARALGALGSRASVAAARWLSTGEQVKACSAACGVFPGQGPNPCPLHCLVESYPPGHQSSPPVVLTVQKIPRVSGAVSQEPQRYTGHLNDQIDIFPVNGNAAHRHSEFRREKRMLLLKSPKSQQQLRPE